jgi:conjugative relaxase-like TrwC/TraI family protein
MSVAPMGADSAGYYVGMVLDVEDYYLQPSEEPGRWHGPAAADLGLTGRVERADLEALLEGRDPRTGTRIGTWTKRPAYDLTLSAPKSVSLMWGLGDRGVASTVESAHDRAVEAAFGYLDEYACVVRRGHGGTIRFDGDGLIAAVFRHRTSRALDPDLHSHVLVANMTRGADGEWSCPFGTLLFKHARAAGCIYQSVLRRELSERLGVRFGEVTKGSADIVGIDRPARRAFSKRRIAIEERMAEHGTKSRRGAEIAALDTRPNKGEPIAEADLRKVWSVEAAEIGLDVASSLGRPGPVAVDVGSDADLAQVLTEKNATFERRRIVEAVASSSRSGLRPEEIEVRIDEFIDSDYCLRLPTGHYTTPEMLAIETEVVDFATTSPARASATHDAVAEAMRVRPSLSAQQRLAVGSITGSEPISCVVGHAGAGKTFALDAARAAWQASGLDPIGCSLAARAARQLETSSGIESDTADKLLAELDAGRRRFNERSVVVVDEAGMLGSRRLRRIVRHVREANAKLVLVGDPKQLPEIDAGGLFTVLAHRLGCAELTENRRQRQPAEREAAARLRDGKVEEALLRLSRAGRVSTNRNAHELRSRMVDDWHRETRAGSDAVMLALHRSDVADLNRRARARRLAAGELGETVLEIGNDQFAIGDRVMTLRNNRRLGVLNGTLGTVIGADGNDLVIATDDGERRSLPLHYVVEGYVAHAYAFTIHKAQGLAVDVALLLGDDTLFAEAGYTGITRGREQNRLYLVDPYEGDALKTAQRALERSAAKQTAIEQLGLGL